MTSMSLQRLFADFADPVVQVSGLALDSRQVIPGDLFIALKGSESDGHDFVQEAVRRGAAAIASEKRLDPQSIPVVQDAGLRARVGELAARFYGEPALSLRTLAVTGTNGKTSVAWYIACFLHALGESAACHGTIGWGTPPKLAATSLTTPDPITLQARLNALRFSGVRWLALEASSHALDQHRLAAVNPEVAIFTNLSRDHLDYHPDLEAYLEAKARLFRFPSIEFALINSDDPAAKHIEAATNRKASRCRIGLTKKADVRYSIKNAEQGVSLMLRSPWGMQALRLPLIGETGALNLVTAMASLAMLGFELDQLADQAPRLPQVPGRMQVFSGRIPIIVDYAHTPDALQNTLSWLKGRYSQGVICVFGCGGDRDQGKRVEMAQVVDSLASQAWVTDDNPRHECPSEIRSQICRGFTRLTPHNVADRVEAAEQAYASASAGQALLLAGKGHELGIERAGCVIPHSDLELATSLTEAQAC